MIEVLRDNRYTSDDKVKTAAVEWLKEKCQNFKKKGYMFSFEGGTLLLKDMVTMLRSRDVIHQGQVSFWYIFLCQ